MDRISANIGLTSLVSMEREVSCTQVCYCIARFIPSTASAEYIRVFILYWHIKYHLLNILKMKCDINQQDLKRLTSILSTMNNFHSLEVVDRVSETQLQVGENSNRIILAVKVVIAKKILLEVLLQFSCKYYKTTCRS